MPCNLSDTVLFSPKVLEKPSSKLSLINQDAKSFSLLRTNPSFSKNATNLALPLGSLR